MSILFAATAFLGTRGVKGRVWFGSQDGSVTVQVQTPEIMPSPRWQIHELPVDLSLDPKKRCKLEHVGRYLQYGSHHLKIDYIDGVTIASLVLHSIVLLVNDEAVACGSIVPFSLPDSAVTMEFKMGVFGQIFMVQWQSKIVILLISIAL